MILDIFSRYVVGWIVASRESKILAQRLIAQTLAAQNITAAQLTLHADRGSSMTSKPVALLLADLGVTKSHSRPHTSNDNPFSESQFRTFKYRPDFPHRFESIEASRLYCGHFFDWYNHEHKHSGIGLHTPADVHYGRAPAIHQQRATVLNTAFLTHPERFVRKPPQPPPLPTISAINPPTKTGGQTDSLNPRPHCLKKVDRHRSLLPAGTQARNRHFKFHKNWATLVREK